MHKKIYGIRFTPSNPSSGVSRLYDAEGLCYRQQVAENVEFSDFDHCYPWSEIKECNILVDGQVIYANDPQFSRGKNTFIEIPVFYFKRTVRNNEEEWLISGYPHEGFEIEPWFADDNGNVSSHRYIAKYEGCDWKDGLVSVSGQIPFRSRTIGEYKEGCRSAGFQLCSIYAYLAIAHLFAVECATLDSQSVNSGVSYIPYASRKYCLCAGSGLSNTVRMPYHWRWETVEPGNVIYAAPADNPTWDISDPRVLVSMERDGEFLNITVSGAPIPFEKDRTRLFSSAHITGICDNMDCQNGRPLTNSHSSPFLYRGIENIYGNTWEMVDGLIFSEEELRFKIFSAPVSYHTPSNHTYGQSGEGFIAKMGYDAKRPWATLPCELGAEHTSHYCAEWSCFGEGDSAVVFGGGWDHFHCNGIFCMRSVSKEGRNWLYGYRAMK